MKAFRSNGVITIQFDEQDLISGVAYLPGAPCQVTDNEKFLEFIKEQIISFGDSGDFDSVSNFTRLIDQVVTHAVECAAGIEVQDGQG